MEQRRAAAVGLLLLLAVLIVIGWIVYRVANNSAVSATAITALTAVFAVVYGQYAQRKLAVEQTRRQEIADQYEAFVATLLDGMQANRKPAEQAAVFQAAVMAFAQKLLIWGSTSVVTTWITMRARWARLSGPSSDPAVLFDAEELLLAMRKDLGHNDSGLDRGDLLRVFITDLDSVDAAVAQRVAQAAGKRLSQAD
jgi:hypothetical protein